MRLAYLKNSLRRRSEPIGPGRSEPIFLSFIGELKVIVWKPKANLKKIVLTH